MSLLDISTAKISEFTGMNLNEGINYVLFQNPVSATVLSSMKGLANGVLFKDSSTSSTANKLPPGLENLQVKNLVHSGHPFLRLAGISGAAAVILGAYGAHAIEVKEGFEEQKKIYRIANNYHFIHSLALIGVPLSSYPKITGTFMTLGMILFCGTCYYDAFTGCKNFRRLTPVGGACLIFGWLCLIL